MTIRLLRRLVANADAKTFSATADLAVKRLSLGADVPRWILGLAFCESQLERKVLDALACMIAPAEETA